MRVALQEHTKNIQTMGGRNQANPWFFCGSRAVGLYPQPFFYGAATVREKSSPGMLRDFHTSLPTIF
jgi:hypothetical protein